MAKKNVSKARSVRERLVTRAKQVGTGIALSTMSLAAMAQDTPTTVDEAAAFMQTKGAIAVAVAAAITLIYLGITAAKLPRKGS